MEKFDQKTFFTCIGIIGITEAPTEENLLKAYWLKMRACNFGNYDKNKSKAEERQKIKYAYEYLKKILPLIEEAMPSINRKKLLYYLTSSDTNKYWRGLEPVYKRDYLDIETGQQISYFSSKNYWKEISASGWDCHPLNPDEYNDYVIWIKKYEYFNAFHQRTSVYKIPVPFEEVRDKYFSLLEVKTREEAISDLIAMYCENSPRPPKL